MAKSRAAVAKSRKRKPSESDPGDPEPAIKKRPAAKAAAATKPKAVAKLPAAAKTPLVKRPAAATPLGKFDVASWIAKHVTTDGHPNRSAGIS